MSNNPELAARLLGGLGIDQFNREVRERRFAKADAALPPASLHSLLDVPTLQDLFGREAIPQHFADIIERGVPQRLSDFSRTSASLETVITALKRGCTVRVSDLQRFHPPLQTFVRDISLLFAARCQVNAYLTPARQSGFQPHFDTTDVFIIQCHGVKEWKIFDSYRDEIALPLTDTPWIPERYIPGEVAEVLTLRLGDALYIPRGMMHSARCLSEASLHLTVSLCPLTIFSVLERELRRVAMSDVNFRMRIPVQDSREGEEIFERVVQAAIRDFSTRLDLRSLLENERNLATQDQKPSTDSDLAEAILGDTSPTAAK